MTAVLVTSETAAGVVRKGLDGVPMLLYLASKSPREVLVKLTVSIDACAP